MDLEPGKINKFNLKRGAISNFFKKVINYGFIGIVLPEYPRDLKNTNPYQNNLKTFVSTRSRIHTSAFRKNPAGRSFFLYLIPSLSILYLKVPGLTPNRSAAPPGP